ncbi:FkbM family methyltransferase [Bradyrhizobium sp. USDA 4353]
MNQELQRTREQLQEAQREFEGKHHHLEDSHRQLEVTYRELEDRYRELEGGYKNLECGCRALEANHRELENGYRQLEGYHKELEAQHRQLEAAYRQAEDEIYRLRNEPYRVVAAQALASVDLFLLDDLIVEAPSVVTSKDVRDALAAQSYESVELYLARSLVRPGDTVLDLGSGLGVISIAAAKSAQSGRVVGFEADERLIEIARRNAFRNQVNVEYRLCAVNSKAGMLTFNVAGNFLASSIIEASGSRQVAIEGVAFRDIVKEIRPTIIICDIEGAEGEIFANADLSSVDRMIVETHQSIIGIDGVERCVEELRRAGLGRLEPLCWGPVLVFDRDGAAALVRPFEPVPRGHPLPSPDS